MKIKVPIQRLKKQITKIETDRTEIVSEETGVRI